MLKWFVCKMVLFQKMGGMFQEALAMPGPVLSQASPAPSQTVMDTTSTTPYSLQGQQSAIFFSQVGMCSSHILLKSYYIHEIPKHTSIQQFYPPEVTLSRTMAAVTWFNKQWGSQQGRSCSTSWCSATCALSSRGRVREWERERAPHWQ